jgi:hypothetical protein
MMNIISGDEICNGLNDTYALMDSETGELYESLEQALNADTIIQVLAWDDTFGWVLIGEFGG